MKHAIKHWIIKPSDLVNTILLKQTLVNKPVNEQGLMKEQPRM